MEVYDHEQEQKTEAASGAQLWRLNELGLLELALERQMKAQGLDPRDARGVDAYVISRAVASEVLTEAQEQGIWKGVIPR